MTVAISTYHNHDGTLWILTEDKTWRSSEINIVQARDFSEPRRSFTNVVLSRVAATGRKSEGRLLLRHRLVVIAMRLAPPYIYCRLLEP
jgi:hypothetical protein